jgi:hypothetical protein
MRLYFRTFITLLLSDIYHNISQWEKRSVPLGGPEADLGDYSVSILEPSGAMFNS